jgi:hypothetical protein
MQSTKSKFPQLQNIKMLFQYLKDLLESVAFRPASRKLIEVPIGDAHVSLRRLIVKKGVTIPYAMVHGTGAPGEKTGETSGPKEEKRVSNKIIIFSHGNKCQIANKIQFAKKISDEMNVAVCLYEYPGYGYFKDSGMLKPGEQSIREVISAIYRMLREDYGYAASEIYLMGHSMGTGPSLWLAKELEKEEKKENEEKEEKKEVTANQRVTTNEKVAGVILLAPYLSIFRVPMSKVWGSQFWIRYFPTFFFDIFPNIEMIRELSTRVLILHSVKDKVIPCFHSRLLHEKNNEIKYIEMDHDRDLCYHSRILQDPQIFEKMKEFINYHPTDDK